MKDLGLFEIKTSERNISGQLHLMQRISYSNQRSEQMCVTDQSSGKQNQSNKFCCDL